MLAQFTENPSLIPFPSMSADTYLEILVRDSHIHVHMDTHVAYSHSSHSSQSLQVAVFLYCVCHVVVVVLDSMDPSDPIFKSVTLHTHHQCFPRSSIDQLNSILEGLTPIGKNTGLFVQSAYLQVYMYIQLCRFLQSVEKMKSACVPRSTVDMDNSPG